MAQIRRYDDRIYSLSEEDSGSVKVELEKGVGTADFQFQLVREFEKEWDGNDDISQFQEQTLQFHGKEWRVVSVNENGLLLRIWHAVLKLFGYRFPADSYRLHIAEKRHRLSRLIDAILSFVTRLFEKVLIEELQEREDALEINGATSPQEIAKLALSRYERCFLDLDACPNETEKSTTAIIWKEGSWQLAARGSERLAQANQRETNRRFIEGLAEEEETLKEIAAAYAIDFGAFKRGEMLLTPQLVKKFALAIQYNQLKVRIQRINDQLYLVKFPEQGEKSGAEIRISVSKDAVGVDLQRHLVAEFASRHFKQLKEGDLTHFTPSSLSIGNRRWQIMTRKRVPCVFRTLRACTPFVHEQNGTSAYELEIVREKRALLRRIITWIIDLFAKLLCRKSLTMQSNERYYSDTIPLTYRSKQEKLLASDASQIAVQRPTLEAYERGCFAYISGGEAEQKGGAETAFLDPFTQLAARAFQRHETHFANKDGFTPDQCDTQIVRNGNRFELVQKGSTYLTTLLNNQPDIHQNTRQQYKAYLLKEFGAYKIQKVCEDFDINLNDTRALTPEDVYRLNIGLTIVETHDLAALLGTLNKRVRRLTGRLEQWKGAFSLSSPFKNRCTTETKSGPHHPLLPEYQYRKLRQQLPGNNLSDLNKWLSQHRFPEDELPVEQLRELNAEQFRALMEIASFSQNELVRALTGRAIAIPIAGPYVMAERGQQKQWVEQQELIEGSFEFQGSGSHIAYMEFLTYIAIKKQLFHIRNGKIDYIAPIIPAPPDEKEGGKRWYTVDACSSNGYGLLTYRLISSCTAFDLPTIFLSRSTSSSTYALESNETLHNDSNPLNPPGYEGLAVNEADIDTLIAPHTIPVWVSYLQLAKEAKTAQEKAEFLQKAVQDLTKAPQPPSLQKIIQKYDYLLNGLLVHPFPGAHCCQAAPLRCRYIRHFKALKNCYTQFQGRGTPHLPEEKQQQKDAEALYILLTKVQSLFVLQGDASNQPRPRKLIHAIKCILPELDRFLEPDTKTAPLSQSMQKVCELAELLRQPGVNEALQSPKPRWSFQYTSEEKISLNARKDLKDLEEKLWDYAREKRERPQDKTPTSLIFTGHSLGGATAQVQLVHALIKKRRLPLHGKSIEGFFIDSPAILDSDNELFKEFLRQNRGLLRKQKIATHIHHRHEACDVSPLGGQTHLGATFEDEEPVFDPPSHDQREARITFTGEVLKRLPTARNRVVTEAWGLHETRFGLGEEGVDFSKTSFTSRDLGDFNHYNKTSDEEMRVRGKLLRRNIWQIDSWAHAPFTEGFRTSLFMTLFVRYFWPARDEQKRYSHIARSRTQDTGRLFVRESGCPSTPKKERTA